MFYLSREAECFEFSNHYGFVRLVPMGEVVRVKDVRWENVPPSCHVKTIGEMEQIALISQNKHLQACFEPPLSLNSRFYYLAHVSASEVFYCRVDELRYVGPENTAALLESLNRCGASL